MRRNVVRILESLLLVGLVMPAGMLLGVTINNNSPQFGITSNNANWYDTEEATTLLNQMQKLALKTRKEVARLQVQEGELAWQDQGERIERAKNDVNKMGADLLQLNQMENKLEPWQKTLVQKVTPKVHEIVYQMDAIIVRLNKYHSRAHLAMTQYPQNLNQVYKSANRMADVIGTVKGYAQAEQKLAGLQHLSTAKASS